jgi:hypothetical protein
MTSPTKATNKIYLFYMLELYLPSSFLSTNSPHTTPHHLIMQVIETIQGNMAFLDSELPIPFQDPSKIHFTTAEAIALKPILLAGQAIEKSMKESRIMDGSFPQNHPEFWICKTLPDISMGASTSRSSADALALVLKPIIVPDQPINKPVLQSRMMDDSFPQNNPRFRMNSTSQYFPVGLSTLRSPFPYVFSAVLGQIPKVAEGSSDVMLGPSEAIDHILCPPFKFEVREFPSHH